MLAANAQQQGHVGSKTSLQQNPPVLNSRHRLTKVDLKIAVNWMNVNCLQWLIQMNTWQITCHIQLKIQSKPELIMLLRSEFCLTAKKLEQWRPSCKEYGFEDHSNSPRQFLLAGTFSFDWATSRRKLDNAHVDDSEESFLFSTISKQQMTNIKESIWIYKHRNTRWQDN